METTDPHLLVKRKKIVNKTVAGMAVMVQIKVMAPK